MRTSTLYECADFFMLRFANLPFRFVDDARSMDVDRLIQIYQEFPIFQEAIAIASYDLYGSLKNLTVHSPTIEKQKVFKSLVKYMIRMASRSTPFGLFASVSHGKFSSQSCIHIDHANICKGINISRELFHSLFTSISPNFDIFNALRVMINPQIIKTSCRVFLYHNDGHSQRHDSIKRTQLFNYLLDGAQQPILYSDLRAKVLNDFNQIDVGALDEYLRCLVEKSYLISEIQDFVSFSKSPVNFIDRFGGHEETKAQIQILKEIHRSTGTTNSTDLISLYEKNTSKFEGIKNPLHIDAYYIDSDISLHHGVQDALEKCVDFLVQFSQSNSHLENGNQFHRLLVEKFGINQSVPLSEILRCFPREILSKPETKASKINLWNSYFSLENLPSEIDLAKFDGPLPNFDPDSSIDTWPSLDVFCELYASSLLDVDAGNFKIILKGIQPNAGASFGRFLYLWDSASMQRMIQLHRDVESRSDVLFVEIVALPEDHHVSNVAIGLNVWTHRLDLHFHEPHAQSMNLDDISIVVSQERIFPYSKKHQREVCFVLNTLINPQLLSFPLRVLLFLSSYRWKTFSLIPFEFLSASAFLPRISYRNIVLSPAKWHVDLDLLGLKSDASKETIVNALESFLTSLRAPSILFLEFLDHRLLLDRTNPIHLEIIVSQLINYKSILFSENLIDSHQLLIKNGENTYVSEIVVPLIKRHPKSQKAVLPPLVEYMASASRLHLPGGEWLFFKLYLSPDFSNIFLIKHLRPFIASLSSLGIDRWFYIQYFDERFHFRVRLHADSHRLLHTILPLLHDWAASLFQVEILDDFNICIYEREIARYGGAGCIEAAEQFFHSDSNLCSDLRSHGEFSLPLPIIASFGIIHILRLFAPHSSLRELLFLKPGSNELLTGTRSLNKLAVDVVRSLFFHSSTVIGNPDVDFLRSQYESTRDDFENYSYVIAVQEKDRQLTSSRFEIVNSLIHMHCNRLMGISADLENRARAYAAYLIERIQVLERLGVQ